MDTNMEINTRTDQLPTTIRAFLEAQEARDADAALAQMAPGAVISDVGESFAGEDVWVVGHHLEGDFPGGVADLDYRFALEGEQITRLDIVLG